jgi:PAS domain-containing protein
MPSRTQSRNRSDDGENAPGHYNSPTNICSEKRNYFRSPWLVSGTGLSLQILWGDITYLNPVAEKLAGWSNGEALSFPLPQIFKILTEATRQAADNPVTSCLRDGQVKGLREDTFLIRRDGQELSIDDTAHRFPYR